MRSCNSCMALRIRSCSAAISASSSESSLPPFPLFFNSWIFSFNRSCNWLRLCLGDFPDFPFRIPGLAFAIICIIISKCESSIRARLFIDVIAICISLCACGLFRSLFASVTRSRCSFNSETSRVTNEPMNGSRLASANKLSSSTLALS